MIKLFLTRIYFSFLFLILASASPAFAQATTSPWVADKDNLAQQLNDGATSLGTFNIAVFSNLLETIKLGIGGASVKTGVSASGQPIYSQSNGATDIVTNLTSLFYTQKQASSVEYLADLGSSLGLVKPAFAQGVGFSGFSGLLPLWKIFRNVCYLFFIVIFAFVGLMIMFRKKIDPRTVITIQDALPRLVVTLLLITFSYAIAGFLIDIGDLLTKLIIGILSGPIGKTDGWIGFDATGTQVDALTQNLLSEKNVIQLVNPLRGVGGFADAFKGLQTGVGPVDAFIGNVGSSVFYVAAFFVMFKIFFALLTPYVTIVIQIILSPFQLLFSAFPGSNSGLSSWIRGLLSNILVFPVTFALLAIIAIIKGHSSVLCSNNQAFGSGCPLGVYPGCGSCADWGVKNISESMITWAPAVIGKEWGSAVTQLVAFGLLFMVPKVADMVKEALEYKPKSWEGGGGLGQEIGNIGSKVPVIGGFLGNVMK